MAQKKKTKASGKRAAASGGGKKKSGAVKKKPIRREVTGLVFLMLALFSGIGYLPTDAIFIQFFSNLLKGLFGCGFWVIPPAFFAAGVILLTHHGRPVRLRVACMLIAPIAIGIIAALMTGQPETGDGKAFFSALYESGRALKSGGVICGGLGLEFSRFFGVLASLIMCVVVAVTCLLFAFQVNPREMYETARENRVEYEPDPLPERPKVNVRKTARAPVSQIDIPLDNEERNVSDHAAMMDKSKRKGFFNRKSAVPKPHEAMMSYDRALEEAERIAAQEKAEQERAAQEEAERRERAEREAKRIRFIPEDYNVFEDKDYDDERRTVVISMPRQEEPPPAEEETSESDAVPAREERPIQDRRPTQTEPAPASVQAEPAMPTGKKQRAMELAAQTAAVTAEIESRQSDGTPYEFPPYDLLSDEHPENAAQAHAEQQSNLERLCSTLESFGVRAGAGEVVRGPSVTRYEFLLERGVKLSKVTSLSEDLALALGVSNIRIAPIPEKNSVIGIEVPNKHSSMVLIRDVLESDAFCSHASKVAFSLGRDIAGHDIVGNISKLPHVLIAGTTGSGKSVCINSLIVSLLYKATPEEVRFIMVDPKMVELNPYNGIPHLLIPVVTDSKKAAGALQWAVFEMMNRYKTFSEHNVKDLFSYGHLREKNPDLPKMPIIVVVIDELADLMMVAAKEVEESICRVAQMGRAAGMHLVIATQRPSADIITGVMKANIPSRIAFAVASSMESRIILDMTGAEKLVGKGDMLYLPIGSTKPRRIQGCMITEEEIDGVVAFVKESGEAQYSDEVMQKIEESLAEKGDGRAPAAEVVADETDPLFDDAVEVLLETGQASVSMLQRRLKLGYSRAARLIDQMEQRGIVGPFEGSKPRQLLVTRASWDAQHGIIDDEDVMDADLSEDANMLENPEDDTAWQDELL